MRGDLYAALVNGMLTAVTNILKKDKDQLESIDAHTKMTPLMLAVRHKNLDIVRYLISLRANTEASVGLAYRTKASLPREDDMEIMQKIIWALEETGNSSPAGS